jgi:hypothetical protein
MKIKILGFVLSLVSLQAYSATIMDVPAIVGKSKAEVSTLIGAPSSCTKSKYGEKCQFSKGETEIVFIEGKADWITVEAIDSVPFSQEALVSIGFKSSPPSFKNSFSMKWSGLGGLYEVSLFKGEKNSDYAYIKSYTK